MSAQTVITHAPNQGVSLSKIGDAPSPVRVLPLVIMIRSANDDGGWVSPMPRSEMQSMITAALRAGQYYYASGLSGVLHSA